MTSDYAQTFFKTDEKKKSRDSGGTRGLGRVRQVAVKTNDRPSSLTNVRESETCNDLSCGRKTAGTKIPSLCFFCNDES